MDNKVLSSMQINSHPILTGFDIDGTLTEEWYTSMSLNDMKLALRESQHNFKVWWELGKFLTMLRCRMVPVIPCVFITNRPVWFSAATTAWTELHCMPDIIHFHPKSLLVDLKTIAQSKADVINLLRLDVYYDDDSGLRELLVQLCPQTQILAPKDALTNGHAKKFVIVNDVNKFYPFDIRGLL